MLLEQLLQGLEIAVRPFAVCRVGAGQRLDLGRANHAVIHYMLTGEGRFVIDGGRRIALAPGSAVIVPPARRQTLVATGGDGVPCGIAPNAASVCEAMVLDRPPEAAEAVMACGAIDAVYHRGHGLFDYLRDPIIVAPDDAGQFAHAFESLLSELSNPQPGSAMLVRALMQQCLVLVLRRHCESGECRVPWLVALEDPRLGRAVQAMLDDPSASHTVERLADIAGMSRSAFADHFRAAFERAPIDFLKDVRLTRAARLLASGDQPVKSVGAAVGYDSRSYFTRAFADHFGVSPAAYRATAQNEATRTSSL